MILLAALLLPGAFLLGFLATRLCLLPAGMRQREFRLRRAVIRTLSLIPFCAWAIELLAALAAVACMNGFLFIFTASTVTLPLSKIWLLLGLLGAQPLPFYLGYRIGPVVSYFADLDNWSRPTRRST
jgi:ABC-type multidrug transport system permease subunit